MAIKAAPPNIEEAAVARSVGEQFGLEGEYSTLVSERDQNFLLRTAGGRRFLVVACSRRELCRPLVAIRPVS
jgi:Ser/Thr protein kinase RdoA (MazF antagonist)